VAAQPLAFGAIINPDTVVEIPWAAEKLPEGASALGKRSHLI
jgi:Flp pilus assembly protein CpaB